MQDLYIGIDIGGTFTDCVSVAQGGQVHHEKVLSSKKDPSEGLMAGLQALARGHGITLPEFMSRAHRLSHGTTIGTNIAVERNGAKVGLITTKGHRDALFMMRGTGRFADLTPEQIYNVQETSLPAPLVSRAAVLEVEERVDRNGHIVAPLDEQRVARQIEEFLARTQVDSVAICLLWSFRNPQHELTIERLIRKAAPSVFVSTSHLIAPRVGEYERMVATVLNSYVGPFSTRYLERTRQQLTDGGMTGPFLIMQCNGGVVPASTAASMPLSLIGSGPAGGLVGSATLARHYGHPNVIATDMGGTSFDVGLIVDHEFLTTDKRLLDKYTYLQPAIDIQSIACGGGSIARFDPHSRSMRVGPDSAGSEPGPACYGRGGSLPTVTDADVVLGLIRPDGFLGGSMRLDKAKADAAVGSLAKQLDRSLEETAAGILRLNNHNAATLIRQQTLERGYDTRDFVIYAFGGAGPVHAFGFAPELGIRRIVVPLGNGASTLSAYGIASSPIVQFCEIEVRVRAPFTAEALTAAIGELDRQSEVMLARSGHSTAGITLQRFALMRYSEQRMHSLTIPLPDVIAPDTGIELERAFGVEYARLYGEAAQVLKQTPEVFAIRMRATQPLDFTPLSASGARSDTVGLTLARAEMQPREVFWPSQMRRMSTRVLDGSHMPLEVPVEGPAIIELPHTSIVVDTGQSVRKDSLGSFEIELSV